MDSSILKEQIKEILDSITEQTETIRGNNHKIPQIELDIIKENIRKLYEFYHQLDCQNSKIYASEHNNPEPIVEKELSDTKQNQIADDVFVEQVSEKSEIKTEKIPEVESTLDEPKNVVSATSDPDLFSSDHETLVDKLKNDKKVLHDQLVSEKDDSIAAKMQKNPIKDLKAAIGINEKFLFINELFKGDMEEYNSAIEDLNNSATLNNAVDKLKQIKENRDWEEDTEAFLSLYEFIQRRFMDV